MAEESPQDSSKHQEMSGSPDVNAGEQTVNSVEDIEVAQGSQGNRTRTNHKKYDLGVLFVHGIGFQKPGDTFNAIYPSIKNEFNSNRNYEYSDLMRGTKSNPEVESNITYNGITKKILFRESNWHRGNPKSAPGAKNTASIKNKKCCLVNILSPLISFILSRLVHPILSHLIYPILSVIQSFFWIVYFIGMRISSARSLGFTLSISAVFLFLILHNKVQEMLPNMYNQTNIAQEVRESFVWSGIFSLAPILIFLVIWSFIKHERNNKSYNKVLGNCHGSKTSPSTIWGAVVKLVACLGVGFLYIWTPKTIEIFITCSVYVGLSYTVFAIFSSEEVSGLWKQINESADYVRTGDNFLYMQNLEKDIDNLQKVSDKIILLSHSMGEYLSYNSIRKNIGNFAGREVQLISIGGGLGLVSLIGDLRLSDKKGDFSICKSVCLSFVVAMLTLVLAAGNIYSWCGLAFDIYRFIPVIVGNKGWGDTIVHPFIPFEIGNLICNTCLHVFFAILFGSVSIFVEKIRGIKPVNSTNFKFFRYSHLMDPVGNLAGFYYGHSVEQTITPNGSIGHSIRTYFTGKSVGQKRAVLIRDVYMPNRSVQHITSTVYGDPALLAEKTKPGWNVLMGIISWIVASLLSVVFFMKSNIQLTLVFSPLFIGFNYITFLGLLWIWKVAKALREESKYYNNKFHDVFWSFFWLVICTAVNVYTDIIVLSAIENVLSIGV